MSGNRLHADSKCSEVGADGAVNFMFKELINRRILINFFWQLETELEQKYGNHVIQKGAMSD